MRFCSCTHVLFTHKHPHTHIIYILDLILHANTTHNTFTTHRHIRAHIYIYTHIHIYIYTSLHVYLHFLMFQGVFFHPPKGWGGGGI